MNSVRPIGKRGPTPALEDACTGFPNGVYPFLQHPARNPERLVAQLESRRSMPCSPTLDCPMLLGVRLITD
jgi:hypothetical protein